MAFKSVLDSVLVIALCSRIENEDHNRATSALESAGGAERLFKMLWMVVMLQRLQCFAVREESCQNSWALCRFIRI